MKPVHDEKEPEEQSRVRDRVCVWLVHSFGGVATSYRTRVSVSVSVCPCVCDVQPALQPVALYDPVQLDHELYALKEPEEHVRVRSRVWLSLAHAPKGVADA